LDRWERERLVGRQAKVKLLPAQPGESPATCADIAAASRDLGYRPATPLEEGCDASSNGTASIGSSEARTDLASAYAASINLPAHLILFGPFLS
jgi:hypothetical protein